MGALATVRGWAMAGPKPPPLSGATTGDAELAGQVKAAVGNPARHRGLVVAVIAGGTVRFAGLGDDRGGVTLDEHTAFEIGSVGKALTGMLLAELIQDGTVRADEPLAELLPDVDFRHPAMAGVTLAELASHRSGLAPLRITGAGQALGMNVRAFRGRDPYAGQDAGWLISSVAKDRPGKRRGTVEYSNYGVALLGQVLAVRAGIPYPELLRQRILAPLSMDSTGHCLDGADLPARHASGQAAGGRAVAPWQASGYAPAGVGLWSTAADLARLVSALLGGTAPGADAATPRFDDTRQSRIGYGWFTLHLNGQEITWHNGGTGGFRSYVGFDPAAGWGVVVLGNTSREVDRIGQRLLTGQGDVGAPAAPAPAPSPPTLE